jgi:hypothetical protein
MFLGMLHEKVSALELRCDTYSPPFSKPTACEIVTPEIRG